MTPPVSIVLPTLNERAFIRDCLDSLLAQDYPEIGEILVVDGGSTDGTREIATMVGGTVRVVDNPACHGRGGDEHRHRGWRRTTDHPGRRSHAVRDATT